MPITLTTLLLLALLTSSRIALAGDQADVKTFIRNADTCEHVAGEWDSELSEADQKRIQRAVIKYCGSAQNQSKILKKKYRNNPRVLKTISEHENDAVTSFVRDAEAAQ
jgi:hypothetical protein